MNVTRDVIYDLLPGYFAGEISPDTRALVDEFLRQDPEFRQMMERFRAVFREPRPSAAASSSGDQESFERARSWLQKRSALRGYVIAFSVATLFVLAFFMRLTPSRPNVAPLFIAGAFALTAAIAGIQLYVLKIKNRSMDR
jgi:anti-sigma factor RsiW